MCSSCETLYDCMTHNKLQLKEGKTEAPITDSQNSPYLPLSVKIGENDIRFSRPVRNAGVLFDEKVSMNKLVKCVSLLAWNCVELDQQTCPYSLCNHNP